MTVKPNFFIVGAAKSGTTSLYQYLGQHPDIYFSPVKEPNYFSSDIDISKFSSIYKRNTYLDIEKYFSEKTLKNLQLTFVRDIENYEQLFVQGNNFKLKGESSTSYLYSRIAAKKIFEYNPQSKIIVVLRNPMERAFSHYQMAVKYGHTKLDFRAAIERDIMTENKGWGISELFIELGLYYDQLLRYYSIFPPEYIKVLLFTDLKNSTQKTLDECFDFLGVENLKIDAGTIYNFSKEPKSRLLNYFLTRTGIKKQIKNRIPKSIYNALNQSFYKPVSENLSKNNYDFLLNIYKSDIKKTASLINKDLSSWLNFRSV